MKYGAPDCVAEFSWGEKRYMNMEHLLELDSSQSQTLVG